MYRSKERKGGVNPFSSYMLNKKWTLEEEFNNHMLRFQQVTWSQLILFISAKSTFSRLDCWSSKVFSKWKQKKKSQNPLEWNISIFPLVYGQLDFSYLPSSSWLRSSSTAEKNPRAVIQLSGTERAEVDLNLVVSENIEHTAHQVLYCKPSITHFNFASITYLLCNVLLAKINVFFFIL